MFRRGRPVPLRGSPLALLNNLAVLPVPEKQLLYLGCVQGGCAGMVSASLDGLSASHRQLQTSEGPPGSGPLLTQVSWCVLPSRVLLVLASQKGVQMYESDGSVLVFWHSLDGLRDSPAAAPEGQESPGQAVFARGVAASGQRFICVGTSLGCVLVFDVPAKGTNVLLSEVLEEHRESITDIGTELCKQPEGAPDMVTADDSGTLCVWRSGEAFKKLSVIPGSGCTCSSVKLWNGIIAAGYGNGQIRLYEAASGTLRAQVAAHARWIYALDVAPLSGKMLSGAEDSYVQVWGLSCDPDLEHIELEHLHTECVTDTQVCGARFCNPEGTAFAVTGYELNEIIRYSQV